MVVVLVVVLVVLVVDVVLVVEVVLEGDAVELVAPVGELDSTTAGTLDSVASVVVVSDPQAAVITATTVTASTSVANRFTGVTVPDDLGATLAP